MNKNTLFIILLLLITSLGIFLRIHDISSIPASISYDELDHVVNGKSLALTGKDLQGQHYFWELYPTKTHTVTAELGALWHALPQQMVTSDLLYARLPNVIAGFVFVFAFAYFAYLVFQSRTIAILTFALLIVSPWHILLSRTAYEAPIALTWLILSIVTFWQALSFKSFKVRLIFLAITLLTMLASFFTYHGYKPIYPFIYILIYLWIHRLQKQSFITNKQQFMKRLAPLLIVLSIWLIIFSLFSFRLMEGDYGNRSTEISLLNPDLLSQEVNKQRQLAFDSNVVSLFTNKLTVLTTKILTNFLDAFNITRLFITGFDNSFMIGLWEHGFLYLLQLPLLFLGLAWAIKNRPRDTIFLMIIIGISLIPSIIHTSTSISLRSGLFVPVLVLFSSLGAYSLIMGKYLLKKIILTCVYLALIMHVGNFAYFYFYRYPIYTIDTTFFQERMLAAYVLQNREPNTSLIILAEEPFNSLRVTAFYGKQINNETINTWPQILKDPSKDTYRYNNMIFTKNCKSLAKNLKNEVIIASPRLARSCNLEQSFAKTNNNQILVLPSPKDNHDYYRIFNDQLCKNQPIQEYIQIRNAKKFAIEELTPQELCTTWIRKEILTLEQSTN